MRKLDVLGSMWPIHERDEKNDSELLTCSGYAETGKKFIVVSKHLPKPLKAQVLRHEVAHAVFDEAGVEQIIQNMGIPPNIAHQINELFCSTVLPLTILALKKNRLL